MVVVSITMSQKVEQLKRLLAEIFQLDQADLDFGIYRIMNTKREEIGRFLDRDLLPQVRKAFHAYACENRETVQKALDRAIEQARELGADPESLPRVKELKDELTKDETVMALEDEVYSHLYNFFRRYYQEGDFISLRRYKEGVYAIPYEGEDVKLHWANHDQYYTKTSEYLRDYIFRLPSGKGVHFKLVDADADKDNNRSPNGHERRFILSQEQPLAEENGELVIRFDYCPHPDKAKQADLNKAAVDRILNQSKGFDDWRRELASVRPTEKNANRTLLEKHLTDYTARNTFDYFIHKDLNGFLRRELDFYIKNEVMHLDDVESDTAPRVEQYLSKIKAVRHIAHKIIDFLAQIENFQKKLWLKKKFVVETQYCVTLDRILAIEDEDARNWLIEQIIKNDAQREEWVSLCAIDEVKGDLMAPGYSKPLKPDFLKANRTLVVDTRHFAQDFKRRMLAAFDDIDGTTEGLLIHGENFQALSLLQARFREQVKCVYIDPPYNTDASAIDYKNGYKASSWISLIEGRVSLSKPMLTDAGVLVAAIDDEQHRELSFALSNIFKGRLLGTMCVRANPSGRPTQTGYSVSHEYLLFAGQSDKSGIGRLPPTDEQMARFRRRDEIGPFEWRNLRREGSNSDRSARRALYYPIYIQGAEIRVPTMSWDHRAEEWIIQEDPNPGEQAVWPDNEEGAQKTWRWEWKTVMSSLSQLSVRKDRSGRDYLYYKRRPHEEGVVSVSSWFDAKYSATEHGTSLLKALFGRSTFSYPKSIHAVVDAVYIAGASDPTATVLDYFAGSGTTGHAIINLNRKDGGRRKFILMEMGAYFDSVLLPRIKKVTFTPEWRDGKPMRSATAEESERSPRVVKVVRLESYDDTLNNIELRRTGPQQTILEQHPAFREDYVLRYMVDVEARESPSLLNVYGFEDPFNYKLNIATGSARETKPTVVDLVETFNYLIGLRVKTIDDIRGVRVVTGTNPQGERVLILWRKIKELDNNALDEWFRQQSYNANDQEFDLIYVNGDHNLENLRKSDQTWKAWLIEEQFRRLMFDVQDV